MTWWICLHFARNEWNPQAVSKFTRNRVVVIVARIRAKSIDLQDSSQCIQYNNTHLLYGTNNPAVLISQISTRIQANIDTTFTDPV